MVSWPSPCARVYDPHAQACGPHVLASLECSHYDLKDRHCYGSSEIQMGGWSSLRSLRESVRVSHASP